MLKEKEEDLFIFNGYQLNKEDASLTFSYVARLKNKEINFQEKLFFPKDGFSVENIPEEIFNKIIESLSLSIGVVYWKAHCIKNISIGNIKLTKSQSLFWNNFYSDGLGEFYYKNKLNPNDSVVFPFVLTEKEYQSALFKRKNRSLLFFGGGRDSIVSAEILKKAGKEFFLAYVNSDRVKEETSLLIDRNSLIVKREIDQKIIDWGKKGEIYNGHIPISLIWGFIYVFVALVYDFKYIISSNERSSNFGNVDYCGKMINHQWSKSGEAERLFNDYLQKFITPEIEYFSLLRPMSEIKITEIFSKYEKYFSKFSSCNANFKIENKLEGSLWCGHCPKCVFVFTLLSAFLEKKQLIGIFGKNLYEDKNLLTVFEEILGVRGIKPFECVGTPDEMNLALKIASEKEDYKNDKIIKHFKNLLENVEKEKLHKELFSLSGEHNIPSEFYDLVKNI